MRKVFLPAIVFSLLLEITSPLRMMSAPAMIFFNGSMGSAAALTTSQINGVRASGMTTIVIFTMGVDANGNFNYGGVICSNGVYTGPSNWGSLLAQCKASPSSVTRIEMCIGGSGDPSWSNIKNVIAANGTNSSTVLYQNLVALKNALGIDAIDNDDESAYDSASAIKFGQMCASVGLKSTLCPYTNPSYWQAVKASLGTNCDAVYLQCYEGGAGNNPATWNNYFGGLKVIAGYWDWERDTTFVTNMLAYKNAGAIGGFLWPSCTGCSPPADGSEMAQYGDWIQDVFNSVVTPVTAADVVGGQVTFTASSFVGSGLSYQWQVINSGVTNNIPGATNLSLTLSNLQLTNAGAYQIQASNSSATFYSSASTLAVSSVPSPVNNMIATYAAQTGLSYGFYLTPSWTVAPGSLIAGMSPSSVGSGDFTDPYAHECGTVAVLTDGSVGYFQEFPGNGGGPTEVACGSGAGQSVTYTLTTSSTGYNLTNITVYGGWGDAGRDQQAYTIYYSKATAPATFIQLKSVFYSPSNPAGVESATRVTLTPASRYLATNVAALKFDFTTPAGENGYEGYSEIAIYGVSISPAIVADTLPATAMDVVGSSLTFTAGVTGTALNYQWQKISGGATNDIAGATNSTLTLINLQLSDTASYQLLASNVYGVAVSTPRAVTVNSAPSPVNNIITAYAAQTGWGGTIYDFYPTWTVAPGSLIAGMSPSSVGPGDFSDPYADECGTVAVLTDGSIGFFQNVPNNGGSPTEVACGPNAGQSVTYTLPASAYGYNLTNITVYGGWGDDGRDQQAYTIYYSTLSSPNSFVALSAVSFQPSNPLQVQSATRATLTAASGYLATNVAALKFDFTTPTPENYYCGYSEIQVFGVVSLPPAVPTTVGVAISTPGSLVVNINDMVVGRDYEMQSTTNLVAPVWTTETNFTATTSSGSITNSISTEGQRFYRVVGF